LGSQLQLIKQAYKKEAAIALKSASATMTESYMEYLDADFLVKTQEIRSPVDGVIVNSDNSISSSVIAAGETVLEIIPTTRNFIVSARISPSWHVGRVTIISHARMIRHCSACGSESWPPRASDMDINVFM
tara:strand:+ start:4659 stop:5051 length:393 start_codon:yes stop_codon:yes gene_type:complete